MLSTTDLASFQGLVRDECGLSVDAYKADTLVNAIRARMAQRAIKNEAEYFLLLTQNTAELETLVSLLTVNETYFMREGVHFELLSRKLFGELLAARTAGTQVRILTAGCSSGEETYSVMISLLESHGILAGQTVSIIGVDIDGDALSRAERGVYQRFSFRALSEMLRQKYFEPLDGNTYRIRDSVRAGIRFMPLNLASDEYPDSLSNLDVIFYRNVSIYFDPPTQKRIFKNLAGLLNSGGWLFVSSTETFTHDIGVLTLEEMDGVFCFRNAASRKVPLVAVSQKPSPSPSRAIPAVPSAERAPQLPRVERPSFDSALALAQQKRYEEALASVDQFLLRDPSFVKAYMLRAGILVNMKRVDEAKKACFAGLEKDRWNVEAHLLLGLISQLEDDVEVSLKRFREAVYLLPSCWLAHFYLAQIYSSRHEAASARREYRIVVKLLEEGSDNSCLTFFPLAHGARQIMHLCRHNLTKLSRHGV